MVTSREDFLLMHWLYDAAQAQARSSQDIATTKFVSRYKKVSCAA
jgi:hypothetical protein